MAAKDIKAGSAYVELLLRDSRFNKGLSAANRGLASFARGALAIAGPVAGALSFGAIIKSASDLEEVMNKFNVVFGDNAKVVKEWGDGLAKDVGRSQKQIAEFMANTQDLFVPLGFEPGAATEMSKEITKLGIDLASFNNMQDADTIRDLHAALTGSGEVMKKYGVVLSEAAVKQELLNQKIKPEKATQQEKVQARLNIIMAGTTAAQGDAIRSAGGFANQMKALQGRIYDTAASIGSAILPAVTSLVGAAITAVDWLKSLAESGIQRWSEMIEFVSPIIAAFAETTRIAFDTIWQTARIVWDGVMNIVSSAWGGITGGTSGALEWLQNAVITSFSAVSFVINNWQLLLRVAFKSAQVSLVTFANQTIYFFGTVIPGYIDWFGKHWREVFTDIVSFTATVASNIWTNLVNLWDGIVGLFSGEGFSFEWTPLTEGFKSAITELPQIAEREMGPLEKSLKNELAGLTDELGKEWDSHNERFRKSIGKHQQKQTELAGTGSTTPADLKTQLGKVGGNRAQQQRSKDLTQTFTTSVAAAFGGGGVATKQLDESKRQTRLLEKIHRQGEMGGALT